MDKMLCMEVGLTHSGTVVRGTVVEKIDRASQLKDTQHI
jgi:hypothetical protein